MTEETKIIEINGVKFEVDSRSATIRQVEKIQIGARVKVLKKLYNDTFNVYHGVVVGFEPFKENPTVIIAYIEENYTGGPDIKFLYFNNKSTEQIVISAEEDKEALSASNVVAQIDKAIAKKQAEIQDLEDRKTYFLRNFKTYWETLELPAD